MAHFRGNMVTKLGLGGGGMDCGAGRLEGWILLRGMDRGGLVGCGNRLESDLDLIGVTGGYLEGGCFLVSWRHGSGEW